jgi:uncharacterized protein (TIGR02246 family)
MVRKFALLAGAVATVVLFGVGKARAGSEDEVKALFAKFIAAQNAHDIKAVGDILEDSPRFLWITRGAALWGRDAALKRYEENYQGTWQLEPKFDEVQITEIAPGVVRVFAPSVFTIAPAGQTAQPRRFLLTQVYVKTAESWKLSTLLPFPTP